MKHNEHETEFAYYSESGEEVFFCNQCCQVFLKGD